MWKREPKNRQGMWEVIRKLRVFTVKDIQKYTDHQQRTVAAYLRALHLAGYLSTEEVPNGKLQPAIVYTLVKDGGRWRPMIDDQGNSLPPSARQRMWASIKVIGNSVFDYRDLSFTANTDPEDTKQYLKCLQAGGYIRVMTAGKAMVPARYRFNRDMNTGPFAPEWRNRKSEIYDANTQEMVWKKGHVRALDAKTGKVMWVKDGAK